MWSAFPAGRAGVRAGCELVEIDGTACDASSWLSMFEISTPPFPITLDCKRPEAPVRARHVYHLQGGTHRRSPVSPGG